MKGPSGLGHLWLGLLFVVLGLMGLLAVIHTSVAGHPSGPDSTVGMGQTPAQCASQAAFKLETGTQTEPWQHGEAGLCPHCSLQAGSGAPTAAAPISSPSMTHQLGTRSEAATCSADDGGVMLPPCAAGGSATAPAPPEAMMEDVGGHAPAATISSTADLTLFQQQQPLDATSAAVIPLTAAAAPRQQNASDPPPEPAQGASPAVEPEEPAPADASWQQHPGPNCNTPGVSGVTAPAAQSAQGMSPAVVAGVEPQVELHAADQQMCPAGIMTSASVLQPEAPLSGAEQMVQAQPTEAEGAADVAAVVQQVAEHGMQAPGNGGGSMSHSTTAMTWDGYSSPHVNPAWA